MSNLDVRIVKLPPMRVACINGFGKSPEGMAFSKMKAWAEAHGLIGKPYRLFGYNNPNPSPGSPNYGYDVWVMVEDAYQPEGKGKLISYGGGLYAVTHCSGVETISTTWQEFIKWREKSPYHFAHDHQWLEEFLNPDAPIDQLEFDLYMPIRE